MPYSGKQNDLKMPKLRRQKRRQKFQFNRNRRRVRKSQESGHKGNVRIQNEVLKRHWDGSKPVKQNLRELGIALDANEGIGADDEAGTKAASSAILSTKQVTVDILQDIISTRFYKCLNYFRRN